MNEWWQNLETLTQVFYVAAAFFSVIFLWQLIATLIGLGGGESDAVDTGSAGADHSFGHGEHAEMQHDSAADAHATMLAFKLLSIRSVLAFFTLFTWAGALYLQGGSAPTAALGIALLWGLAGMLGVAGLFYLVRRLTETGNPRLATCLGAEGVVYLDIPAGGQGEVRVLVSGVMTHLKARTRDGQALKAGAPVRVLRLLGSNTIEIQPLPATPAERTNK